MANSEVIGAPCQLHPDAAYYGDPATRVRRCIDCENERRDQLLLDWRDFDAPPDEQRRIQKRLMMRKINARRTRAKASAVTS